MQFNSTQLFNQLMSASWKDRNDALEKIIRIPIAEIREMILDHDFSIGQSTLQQIIPYYSRWAEESQVSFLAMCWELSPSLRPALSEIVHKLPPRKSRDFATWLIEHGHGWELGLGLEILHRYGSQSINGPIARILQNIEELEPELRKTVLSILRQKPQNRFLRILWDKVNSCTDPVLSKEYLQVLAAWAPRLNLPWNALAKMVVNPRTGIDPKDVLRVLESAGRTDILSFLAKYDLVPEHPLFKEICGLLAKRITPVLCNKLLVLLVKLAEGEQFEFLKRTLDHIPSFIKSKEIRKILKHSNQSDILVQILGSCRQSQDIDLFKELLEQSSDAGIRYEAIRALVYYNDTEIDQYLLQHIGQNEASTIALTMSMIEKPLASRNWVYQELLSKNYPASDTCKQIVLRALASYQGEQILDPLLIQEVEKLIRHSLPKVRLFSIQILGTRSHANTLEQLLNLFLSETEDEVLEMLQESLNHVLGMNFTPLSTWQSQSPKHLYFSVLLLLQSNLGLLQKRAYLQEWLQQMPIQQQWQLLRDIADQGLSYELILFWALENTRFLAPEEHGQIHKTLSHSALPPEIAERAWTLFLENPIAIQSSLIHLFRKAKGMEKELLQFWSSCKNEELKSKVQSVILELARSEHG